MGKGARMPERARRGRDVNATDRVNLRRRPGISPFLSLSESHRGVTARRLTSCLAMTYMEISDAASGFRTGQTCYARS